jgi:hypothetical protein
MSRESMPIKLGEEMYHLRFTIRDVCNYESRFGSIYMGIDMNKFGFDIASKLLWTGLKDQQKDGSLVRHFEPNEKGLEDAQEFTKKFIAQFKGLGGISTLYVTITMGMVVSGWITLPEPQNTDKTPAKQGDDTPNPKPSRKRSPRKKPNVTS